MSDELKIFVHNIGTAPMYGKVLQFASFKVQDILLEFVIYPTQDDSEPFPFKVQRFMRKAEGVPKVVNSLHEEVKNIYYINTDDEFRKKFKHYYNIIKFETENNILTFGAYSDSSAVPTPDNIYLICTKDFVNLLAPSKKLETPDQLKDTPFEILSCMLDKKELAKELLRE